MKSCDSKCLSVARVTFPSGTGKGFSEWGQYPIGAGKGFSVCMVGDELGLTHEVLLVIQVHSMNNPDTGLLWLLFTITSIILHFHDKNNKSFARELFGLGKTSSLLPIFLFLHLQTL